MLNFIKNLIGVKAEQALNEGVRILVEFDPKAATEAEMRSLEGHLDQLGRELAQARAAYNKEAKEAEEIQKLYNQRLAAAEKLAAMQEAEVDPTRKADLEKSLNNLLGTLEEMGPDIAREEEEAKDAKSFLDSLEEAYNAAGAKFKAARKELEKAEREMRSAEIQKDQARRLEEQARRTAGLSKTTDGLSVAVKAMQETASKNKAEAEAARRKAALLTPTKAEAEDANIAKALAEVQGTAKPAQSMAERLAALKNKQ